MGPEIFGSGQGIRDEIWALPVPVDMPHVRHVRAPLENGRGNEGGYGSIHLPFRGRVILAGLRRTPAFVGAVSRLCGNLSHKGDSS